MYSALGKPLSLSFNAFMIRDFKTFVCKQQRGSQAWAVWSANYIMHGIVNLLETDKKGHINISSNMHILAGKRERKKLAFS